MTMTDMVEVDDKINSIYIYNGIDSVPSTVTHLRVDPSVTEIPNEAFQNCVSLKQVELPEGLEKIGRNAFTGCKNLESINIPSTVREIGGSAFSCCGALQSIDIPSTVLQIIESATFLKCTSLAEVILPSNLNEIKDRAFEECKSLVSIDFPSSLRVIGKVAFQGAGLTEFNLPNSVEDCGSFSGCKFSNLRMPPLITKFDTSIFEPRIGGTGYYNNLFSIELSENVKHVIYPDSVMARLPDLRNIAYPKGCSVDIGDNIEDKEKSYLLSNLFPKLQHRFDDLPLHKICYYHSYHDTGIVLSDMRRLIHPRSTRTRCGKLCDVGRRKDYWSMTPLHILACSTKHHLEMYQLLIDKYPETLVCRDCYGDTPLFYAFWSNAPIEIIEFLAESCRSKHPDFKFDWEDMTRFLARRCVHARRFRILLDTHRHCFPDQKFDLKNVVMEVASKPHDVSITTYQFLLSASIATRLDSLNVRRWSSDLCASINEISELHPILPTITTRVYNKLEEYESYKEAATLLELALWKNAFDCRLHKKARIGHQHNRIQCRIQCGADIVIQNVLPFLWLKTDGP